MPLVRRRPPEVGARVAPHVEEVVEVLGDVLREVDRDEEAHGAILSCLRDECGPRRAPPNGESTLPGSLGLTV